MRAIGSLDMLQGREIHSRGSGEQQIPLGPPFSKGEDRHSRASRAPFGGRATFYAVRALIVVCVAVGSSVTQAVGASIHPTFPLLDENGAHVLQSGGAVSAMTTCGRCHDTAYISSHSYHADVGLSDVGEPGSAPSGRAWDVSTGLYGRWNPITYRYLTPEGDFRMDLGTASWVQMYGARHVGGGPAFVSRNGQPLTTLKAGGVRDADTHVADPVTGRPVVWDWQASGGVEMNCFLCHTPQPNNEARIAALQSGRFRWASTATLEGTGIVQKDGDAWRWARDAFDAQGHLKPELLRIQDPENANCGLCHGLVHVDGETPLITTGCRPGHWSTETTGQIISPQRISRSGMNLSGKETLSRAWDVHAERLVTCTNCHFSPNNPIYRLLAAGSSPSHLVFDARRLDIGDYLQRPSHQFAKGESAQGVLAPGLDASMRRCASCHKVEDTHKWLPYRERHMAAMGCETCHIPRMYAPARRQFDWTVLTSAGGPRVVCRGAIGKPVAFDALITGYEPVLLPQGRGDGRRLLMPHNLVSSWFWVAGNPERPVREKALKAVYLSGEGYHSDVVAALDRDGDGALEESELMLDTPEKVDVIARKLRTLGLENPRIMGEIQPYSINHTVTTDEWATRDCRACHSGDSRISRPMVLASYVPGNVLPEPVRDANVAFEGRIHRDDMGQLVYAPTSSSAGLYVLGHDSDRWANTVGLLAVFGVLAGVVLHGGMRFRAARRQTPGTAVLRRVYMYSAYERLWHWLQALGILALILTGLEIHLPDTVGLIGFGTAVRIHNILGFALVINAALAAFYHLASGDIRQFLPGTGDFFTQAISQVRYYLRGILAGEAHPFEKQPNRKLNPLQQMTYLVILNVLLPVQVLTGIMIWGAQRWPDLAGTMGGLAFLGPLHSLTAWLFAAFLIVHIYLTTTGRTPVSNIKAMVVGWEDVEGNEPSGEGGVSDERAGR